MRERSCSRVDRRWLACPAMRRRRTRAPVVISPPGRAASASPGELPQHHGHGRVQHISPVPWGGINVARNINVAHGAALDAQSAPSTITVEATSRPGPGSLLRAGLPADKLHWDVRGSTVRRSVRGRAHHHHRPWERHRHRREHRPDERSGRGRAGKLTVNGNVTLLGGSSENPWSIKGTTIRGNLTIIGVTAEFLRRTIQHDRPQRDPDWHHGARRGLAAPRCHRRRKHGGAEPQLLWTGPRRVRGIDSRRGQPRRSQGDGSVRSDQRTAELTP